MDHHSLAAYVSIAIGVLAALAGGFYVAFLDREQRRAEGPDA